MKNKMLAAALGLLLSAAASAAPFTWPGGAKAAVSLGYDDALDSQLDHVIPALNQRGLRASFYIPINGPTLPARQNEWKAAAAAALPQFVQHPWFDTRWTNWVGLVTGKPVTEDYVPVLPWLGVMLLGFVVTRRWPGLWAGAAPRPLAVLGRWSLSFYMVHQPVLIGVLMAVQFLR